MTLEPTEVSQLPLHTVEHLDTPFSHPSHHGSHPRDPSGCPDASPSEASDETARSRDSAPRSPGAGVDADVLDEKLRGLRTLGLQGPHVAVPGQRILEYENALALQTPKQAIVCDLPATGGVQLGDLPNEILTHVFSHLPPDAHSSVALVSRRFSALISTHHAWRMAFMRHFPGHTAMASKVLGTGAGAEAEAEQRETSSSAGSLRSDTRFFPRLTPNATWRSEFLLRTRYLRSLARGKPSTAHGVAALGGPRSGKKPAAVLTFNSKLPWRVTSLDAVFSNGSKAPRVIQGSGDFGIATVGDPTTGKIEKWGIEDLFSSAQLEDAMTGLVPYGLGQGPAAVPNIVDVSQYYGMLAGEGFPGGRAYFRGVNEPRGRYLNAEAAFAADKHPDIPRVPRGLEAICSVWLAKSPAVPSTTHHMCGMLTGSSLGIVTAYSLGNGSAGSRQMSGEVAARWAVSPGVPVIALKVDERYCQTRKAAKRVWAVALNALGEVYYLTELPSGKLVRTASQQDSMLNAWHAGRTARWHLLQETCRVIRPAELEGDDFLLDRSSSSRDPVLSQHDGLDHEQLVREARKMENFLMTSPARMREVFNGWDMQRRLEVDFAGDDGKGAGEMVFVTDCGLAEDLPASVRRYTRSLTPQPRQPGLPLPLTAPPTPSLFGAIEGTAARGAPMSAVEPQSPRSPPPTPQSPASSAVSHDWVCQALELRSPFDSVICAIALDNSSPSLLTLHEEESRIRFAHDTMRSATPRTDAAATIVRETPGRRARFFVAGTSDGVVLVWNAREDVGEVTGKLQPIRIIKTDSPRISCVAASALCVVHGGSDGLVQAWDPLASTAEPIRTICAKSNGRPPRHMIIANQRFQEADLAAVGTIYLDPDPTILQGIVSFGTSLRSWSYSSAGRLGRHESSHHHRHPRGGAGDPDSRLASRRQAGLFTGHIATEEAELRREQDQQARERSRLLKRFGALGDLTEEEAIVYAQMLSQEEFQAEQQQGQARNRRAADPSASDAGAPCPEDSASSWASETGSEVRWTPDPSVVAGPSNAADSRAFEQLSAKPPADSSHALALAQPGNDEDDDYEQQIQQAIRLSLMESTGEPSPQPSSSPSTARAAESTLHPHSEASHPAEAAEYTVKYKNKASSPPARSSSWGHQYHGLGAAGSSTEDEELMLALSLSMQDQQQHAEEYGIQEEEEEEEFPCLPEGAGRGKGKGVQR